MSLFESAILGIIEGLTEFLPISSTGHLILASHALAIPESSLLKSFEIAIQLGAILAVLLVYWKDFFEAEAMKRIAIAFVPTAIVGLVLYKLLKEYLLGSEGTVLLALSIGGIALIVFDLLHKEKQGTVSEIKDMSFVQALGIGLFQSIAIVPGVSRSAATIVGGLILGMKRPAIVRFSFLLAVPTIAAATGLDILKNYQLLSFGDLGIMAVGLITSLFTALLVIKLFLRFVRKGSFALFGVYRIALAAAFYLIFF